MYVALKKELLFLLSFLRQMVQFDTSKYCTTSKNYFGHFVWIEKKVTSIVVFHFMKRRLKIGYSGQMVLFENFKILYNYFGQFVWIEKKTKEKPL